MFAMYLAPPPDLSIVEKKIFNGLGRDISGNIPHDPMRVFRPIRLRILRGKTMRNRLIFQKSAGEEI